MRIFWLCCLLLPLAGCGRQGGAEGQVPNAVAGNAARPAGPECMAGLPFPANPEQAANEAAARGDLRLFRYEATIATGVQDAVAGFEPCRGRSLDVRSPARPPQRSFEGYYRPDTIELGDIRDRSQPLDNCADCDFPLSTCGRQRLAYAARYNRRILQFGRRGPYPSCPMPLQTGR